MWFKRLVELMLLLLDEVGDDGDKREAERARILDIFIQKTSTIDMSLLSSSPFMATR